MKTNKSRRIKRRSRFRNTRSKRKSLKRQRGGQADLMDDDIYTPTDDDIDTDFETYYMVATKPQRERPCLMPDVSTPVKVSFKFKKKYYNGFMSESSRGGELYIDQITPPSLLTGVKSNNDEYKKLISYFGEGNGNFISIKKPSLYSSFWRPKKKEAAKEIIRTLEIDRPNKKTFETHMATRCAPPIDASPPIYASQSRNA